MDLISFVCLLLLFGCEAVSSEVSIALPDYVKEGDDITIYCLYDLRGSSLHSVRWFLNGLEFYRYVHDWNRPQQIDYSLPGIKLNLIASNGEKVALTQVSSRSAGMYRCEVRHENSYTPMIAEAVLTVHSGSWFGGRSSSGTVSSLNPIIKSKLSSTTSLTYSLTKLILIVSTLSCYLYAVFHFVHL